MFCPLCFSSHATQLETTSVEHILATWQDILGLDIRAEFSGFANVELYQCAVCQLGYFAPGNLAGSRNLYGALEKFAWYYPAHRWEYTIAIQALQPAMRMLEVGCGEGAFIAQAHAKQVDAYGIELNPSAVATAQRSGRAVVLRDLQDLAREQPNTFDAICAFQVLEHIAQPATFIQQCINLLRGGGQLILSVPNRDSFIRFDRRPLLNHPPHHVTRWSADVFKHLTRFFPLRLRSIQFEPLADYHLDWYIALQLNRLPRIRFLTNLTRIITENPVTPIMRRTRLYRLLQGHSVYVRYEKTKPL